MGKLTLVTGGARSGKSSYGEEIIKKFGDNILYIATSIAFDEEMENRIEYHRNSRPKSWDTYEGYKDLDRKILSLEENYNGILLDCVTNLITNLIFDKEFNKNVDVENLDIDGFRELEERIMIEIENIIKSIESVKAKAVFITNELGSGLVPETKLSREFRDIQGRVNQYIAKCSDDVYLLVCGIPMKIK